CFGRMVCSCDFRKLGIPYSVVANYSVVVYSIVGFRSFNCIAIYELQEPYLLIALSTELRRRHLRRESNPRPIALKAKVCMLIPLEYTATLFNCVTIQL